MLDLLEANLTQSMAPAAQMLRRLKMGPKAREMIMLTRISKRYKRLGQKWRMKRSLRTKR
jgi:hypothetical protein